MTVEVAKVFVGVVEATYAVTDVRVPGLSAAVVQAGYDATQQRVPGLSVSVVLAPAAGKGGRVRVVVVAG